MRKLVFVLFVMLTFGLWTYAADDCRHGDHAGKPGHTCSATCAKTGKEVVNTTRDAVLTGALQCAKCDLKRSEKCRKVLTTADNKVYVLCPSSLKGKDVSLMVRKQVEVTGTIFGIKDEDSVVHVNEIALRPGV